MTVAHRLDELYPESYGSFVSILPMFDWQEDLLQEWAESRIKRLQHQGGCWFISSSSLSDAEKALFRKHGIQFEPVEYPIDND